MAHLLSSIALTILIFPAVIAGVVAYACYVSEMNDTAEARKFKQWQREWHEENWRLLAEKREKPGGYVYEQV